MKPTPIPQRYSTPTALVNPKLMALWWDTHDNITANDYNILVEISFWLDRQHLPVKSGGLGAPPDFQIKRSQKKPRLGNVTESAGDLYETMVFSDLTGVSGDISTFAKSMSYSFGLRISRVYEQARESPGPFFRSEK